MQGLSHANVSLNLGKVSFILWFKVAFDFLMANENQIWPGCKLSEDTLGELSESQSSKSEDSSHLAAISTFYFLE